MSERYSFCKTMQPLSKAVTGYTELLENLYVVR
jgi:hypothetical protein